MLKTRGSDFTHTHTHTHTDRGLTRLHSENSLDFQPQKIKQRVNSQNYEKMETLEPKRAYIITHVDRRAEITTETRNGHLQLARSPTLLINHKMQLSAHT